MTKYQYIVIVIALLIAAYAIFTWRLANAPQPVYSDDHSAISQPYDPASDKPYPTPEQRPWWVWY